jgi:hypothetical protein
MVALELPIIITALCTRSLPLNSTPESAVGQESFSKASAWLRHYENAGRS